MGKCSKLTVYFQGEVLDCCRAQPIGKSAADFVACGMALELRMLQCNVVVFLAPLKHHERRASAMCFSWDRQREYSSSSTAGWSHLGKWKKTLNKTGSCRLLLIFPLIDQSWKLNDIYLCSWMSEGHILHQPEGRSGKQIDVALGFLALGLMCKTDQFSLWYLTLISWEK